MASTDTTWLTDALTTASAVSDTVQNVSLDGTLTVAGATQLNSTLTMGADDEGDKSIIFGHDSVKTIMGIDDDQNIFAINTSNNGVFESDNDLELNTSGSLSIIGDFALDGNIISYGGFETSDGDAYLKLEYSSISDTNHPTLHILANNTAWVGEEAGDDNVAAHHATYFDLTLQSDGYTTLKSINSKAGGVLIKHNPDSEGVNASGNIGIFVEPIGTGGGYISIGGKVGATGGWAEVESKTNDIQLCSDHTWIFGNQANIDAGITYLADFFGGGNDGTSAITLYGAVYFKNQAGTEMGSLSAAGALQVDGSVSCSSVSTTGDIVVGGNDIRNSQDEITISMDTSQNVSIAGGLTVTTRFACNGQSAAAAPNWTVSNKSGTPRDLDANGTLAEIGDRVAQLVDDLISIGLLQ